MEEEAITEYQRALKKYVETDNNKAIQPFSLNSLNQNKYMNVNCAKKVKVPLTVSMS